MRGSENYMYGDVQVILSISVEKMAVLILQIIVTAV